MKSILLIYHFFYPDPVVSARLFSDLAEFLVENGFKVTVFTGDHLIRSTKILASNEVWNGIKIQRFHRPNFSQGSNFGRLFNSAVLQLKWLAAIRKHRFDFDAIILGTDPQFAYMMFPILRFLNRKIRLIHWVFDLYPEAILVNSPKWMKTLAWFTKPFAKIAYKQVDDMIDIGTHMRKRLCSYHHAGRIQTMTPWAIMEPDTVPESDPEIRKELFGNAKLGLLYSGTVGHAHNLAPFIELARECRRSQINAAFCFAGYGNCFNAQISCLTSEDTNIRIAAFTDEKELQKRLSAADIHLISLRPEWEGIVVPSKFFGALAIGRPILFSGPEKSEIAEWCTSLKLGWILSEKTVQEIKLQLLHPDQIKDMRQHVFQCYHSQFSKRCVLQHWKDLLCETPR